MFYEFLLFIANFFLTVLLTILSIGFLWLWNIFRFASEWHWPLSSWDLGALAATISMTLASRNINFNKS